jgi:hypothetical protein
LRRLIGGPMSFGVGPRYTGENRRPPIPGQEG